MLPEPSIFLKGGMKAVVWTDTIQVIIMYGSMLVVIIKGSYDAGGFDAVWDANNLTGRIEFIEYATNHRIVE